MSLTGQIKALAAGQVEILAKLTELAGTAPTDQPVVDLGPLNEEMAKLADRLSALEASVGTPDDPAETPPAP